MNANGDLIKVYARQLKLPTLSQYEKLVFQAQEQGWGYEKYLSEALLREINQRAENQQNRRIRAAHFPLAKTLDNFKFNNLPNVEEALVWQLATGEFVERRENVILMGNPGTGKTHLCIGLGRRLCRQGHQVRFYTAANLVTELTEAQNDGRLSRVHRALSRVNLLIVDELSYMTFTRSTAELLFHVLADRNERGSVIISTNLEFSRWGEFFPDEMLAAALVDRLTHNAHILNMNAQSYRLQQRLKKADVAVEN